VPSGVERAFPEELSTDVRGHSRGDGTGVRCAGACSRKVPACVGGGCAGLSAEARGAVRCCLRGLCLGCCRGGGAEGGGLSPKRLCI
jgi:hypothetical protein